MKLLRKDATLGGPGTIKVIPEEEDDVWLAYNLIAVGDKVLTTTVRKVFRETSSGARDSERVKMKLEVKAELKKNPTASADLAVVLMQEGLAHIFLIGRSTTRSHIESSIPQKHGHTVAGYEKALNKFFENVLQVFLRHVDFDVVRCAVLASPGFTKDQFRDYLLLEARQLKPIIENKSRLVVANSTSGYKHSLKDVLESPNIMSMIKNTKAAQEVRALNDFFAMLSKSFEGYQYSYEEEICLLN